MEDIVVNPRQIWLPDVVLYNRYIVVHFVLLNDSGRKLFSMFNFPKEAFEEMLGGGGMLHYP